MNLKVATEDDSKRIKVFFDSAVETGSFTYHTTRNESFFSIYKKFSDDFTTYILIDDDEVIHAVATLLFRKGYLNGEEQIIGFATDLKVSNNRKAILNWSNHFLPVLVHEREKRNCKYVFTVVTQAHRQAYNAFIKQRSPKRKLPRYHLFRKFQIVSLHGLLPFVRKPLDSIVTRKATNKDFEELTDFILRHTNPLPLHYSKNRDEFWNSPNTLFGQTIDDFTLALDSKKTIVGCALPWSRSDFESIYLDAYESQGQSLYQGLKFLSWFGITRSLPKPGGELNFKFLNHFYFENPDIFTALLRKVWEDGVNNEFLSFCHFKDNFRTRLPKSFVKSKLDCGFYCLLAPEDPIPDFLKLAQLGEPPEFHPFFL